MFLGYKLKTQFLRKFKNLKNFQFLFPQFQNQFIFYFFKIHFVANFLPINKGCMWPTWSLQGFKGEPAPTLVPHSKTLKK
jgi:hypothetical protein